MPQQGSIGACIEAGRRTEDAHRIPASAGLVAAVRGRAVHGGACGAIRHAVECARRTLLVPLGLAWLAAAPAHALTTVDFDSLTSLTDVATTPLAGVFVSSALVVSEADAALLTGFDTTDWATSGTNGLLNIYGSGTIAIDFLGSATTFGIRLLSLPGDQLLPGTVTLSLFDGASLLSSIDLTADGSDLPGGFRRVTYDVALLSGTFTHAVISPDSGDPTTFFIDDLTFTPVPEPGAALLIGAGLGVLAVTRRTR